MPYNNKEGGAAPMRRRPMHRRRKVCVFCSDENQKIDYKDANLLRKYISERGKILPRRVTGNCAKPYVSPASNMTDFVCLSIVRPSLWMISKPM